MTPQELKNSILQLAIQGKLVEQIQTERPVKLNAIKLKKTENLEYGIPECWRTAHIECICNSRASKPYQIKESEVCKTGKYPVISQSKEYSIGFSDDEAKLFHHTIPTVVFGDHTTEVKLVDFDFVIGADGVKIFEPDTEIIMPKFLYYYLKYATIDLHKVGGYSRHYKFIKNKPVPLPPLAEQRRIVAKIEELLPYVDRYEKAWNRLEDFNKRFPMDMQKSILQMAIQGKLVEQRPEEGTGEELYQQIQAEKQELIKAKKIKKGKPLPEIMADEVPFEIPETWKWVRLGKVVSVLGGKRIPVGRKLTTDNTGHIYIRVSDMKNGTVVTSELLYVPEDVYPTIARYIIKKEDVYITVAGTIGRVGKIPAEIDGANLTENADRLVFQMINQDWLIKCLESTVVQFQISDATTKVGQPKLAIKRIEELIIPLPPLAEQKRIVERLEELLPLCEKLR